MQLQSVYFMCMQSLQNVVTHKAGHWSPNRQFLPIYMLGSSKKESKIVGVWTSLLDDGGFVCNRRAYMLKNKM